MRSESHKDTEREAIFRQAVAKWVRGETCVNPWVSSWTCYSVEHSRAVQIKHEEEAKRKPKSVVLDQLGGKLCVNGNILTGEEAINYLRQMPASDIESLIADINLIKTLTP